MTITGSAWSFSGQAIPNNWANATYVMPEPIFVDKLESKQIGDKQILLGYDDNGVVCFRSENSENQLFRLNHNNFTKREYGLLVEASVAGANFMYFSEEHLSLYNITTDNHKSEVQFSFGKYEFTCLRDFRANKFHIQKMSQKY